MNSNKVSLPVIKRLPRYYRYVQDLQRTGVKTISSSELARLLGTTASQVRQDFNCFGGFGQQGVGYNVESLSGELKNLLFSGSDLNTILIGAGRLGRTISSFIESGAEGFRLMAIFDSSPSEIGSSLGNLTVSDVANLDAYCKEHHPQVAVLCVPEAGAADLAKKLPELGIKGVWNFSHYDLTSNIPGIEVENVHLGDSLTSLGYRVRSPFGA